jgi:DNA-binding transcriptional LysR family regulator
MLIQSALAGQGVALAWSRLLSDHLQTGSLVRPTQTILRTDAQFFLLEPLGRASDRQGVKRFREWLMAHLAQTEDA